MRNLPAHCRRLALALAVASILALIVTPLLAQPGPHGRFDGPRGEGGPLGRMLHHLDLTEEQRGQIHEIVAARHEAMQEKRELMRDRRTALDDAVHAEEFDETAIRDAAASVAVLEADFAVERALGLREIMDALTDEQRDEARSLMERRRERMLSGERGLRGPRGFRGRGPADRPIGDLDD